MTLTSEYRIMKHAAALLIVCILTSSAFAEPAQDEWPGAIPIPAQTSKSKVPTYVQDKSGRVIALKNLCSSCGDCHKDRDEGTVVKREFKEDSIRIKGLVLEHKNGARSYVNVDVNVNFDNTALIPLELIDNGLQTLLREGRKANLTVMLCGAGGHVVVVDEIR